MGRVKSPPFASAMRCCALSNGRIAIGQTCRARCRLTNYGLRIDDLKKGAYVTKNTRRSLKRSELRRKRDDRARYPPSALQVLWLAGQLGGAGWHSSPPRHLFHRHQQRRGWGRGHSRAGNDLAPGVTGNLGTVWH